MNVHDLISWNITSSNFPTLTRSVNVGLSSRISNSRMSQSGRMPARRTASAALLKLFLRQGTGSTQRRRPDFAFGGMLD